MPMEKCQYCRERVRPPQMQRHLKTCRIKRHADKVEAAKGIVEPIVPPVLPPGKKSKLKKGTPK
jgi:hypothetical protein